MSFGGGIFAAAWAGASHAAKDAASAVATGAKKIVAEAEYIKAGIVTVALGCAHKAKEAFEAVRKTFKAVIAGAAVALCKAENAAVKGIVQSGASLLTKPVLKPLRDKILGKLPADLAHDGETVGAGCKAQNASNPRGTVPYCQNGTPRISGKVVYINGILTDYRTGEKNAAQQDGICKTMQALADATCAEVMGVYNATGGMQADIGESLTNIAKNSKAPAVKTLRHQMLTALDKNPPESLTVYAHSQGGLVTQEALVNLKVALTAKYGKADAEVRMAHVHVKSFGTAEQGWPVGPHYEQFTNTSDPVPGAIRGAQANYPNETFKDDATIFGSNRTRFSSPHWNPVDSHSMDNVYIPKLVGVHGQPNCCN